MIVFPIAVCSIWSRHFPTKLSKWIESSYSGVAWNIFICWASFPSGSKRHIDAQNKEKIEMLVNSFFLHLQSPKIVSLEDLVSFLVESLKFDPFHKNGVNSIAPRESRSIEPWRWSFLGMSQIAILLMQPFVFCGRNIPPWWFSWQTDHSDHC